MCLENETANIAIDVNERQCAKCFTEVRSVKHFALC